MKELRIFPECFVDTKITEILAGFSKKVYHQGGCGDVANALKGYGRYALGIIDEDKNKGSVPKYFSEFDLIKEENNLILKKHRIREQYLIMISPEIEKWLLEDAQKANINLRDVDYDLPDNLKDFKKDSKRNDIDKNIGFYKFIKALVSAEAPSVTTLKNWITLFKENKLDSIINTKS